MRRFLATWALLSPVYLVVAALSSWLVLNLVDLTYEAFAAWLLVPVAQAAALAAGSRRGPLLPPGRPPIPALVPLALSLGVVSAGLLGPSGPRLGFLAPGGLQPLLARALALLAAVAFLVAASRARRGRLRVAALGALLLFPGLDAARPFLATLPHVLLPKVSVFLGGLVTFGGLVALLFAAALAAQRALEGPNPWAARLLGAALAVAFGALHGVALQYFLHPWLEGAWAIAVPAAAGVAASLAAAAGLAAVAPTAEGA
ncbi:MAG: hypothetical protein U0529_03160 [Thermoanaerobaculia bacterium]